MKVIVELNTGRTYEANVPNNFTDNQIINLINEELSLWNENVVKILTKELQVPKKIVFTDEDMISYAKEIKYSSVVDALKIRAFYDKVVETFQNLNEYRWHNLIEDPTDLPRKETYVLIKNDAGKYHIADYWDGVFVYVNPARNKVVAWKYIEPFKEEL